MDCTSMSRSSFKKLTSTATGVGIVGTVNSSRTFGMSLQEENKKVSQEISREFYAIRTCSRIMSFPCHPRWIYPRWWPPNWTPTIHPQGKIAQIRKCPIFSRTHWRYPTKSQINKSSSSLKVLRTHLYVETIGELDPDKRVAIHAQVALLLALSHRFSL